MKIKPYLFNQFLQALLVSIFEFNKCFPLMAVAVNSIFKLMPISNRKSQVLDVLLEDSELLKFIAPFLKLRLMLILNLRLNTFINLQLVVFRNDVSAHWTLHLIAEDLRETLNAENVSTGNLAWLDHYGVTNGANRINLFLVLRLHFFHL